MATPTLYELRGEDAAGGVYTIVYSTTSFQGAPQFDYVGGGEQKHATDKAITKERVPWGTLITIEIPASFPYTKRTFTIVLPDIEINQLGFAAINTFGIKVESGSLIQPPPIIPIQTQHYTVIPLSGTARAVVF